MILLFLSLFAVEVDDFSVSLSFAAEAQESARELKSLFVNCLWTKTDLTVLVSLVLRFLLDIGGSNCRLPVV